jgi:hypothetical protein
MTQGPTYLSWPAVDDSPCMRLWPFDVLSLKAFKVFYCRLIMSDRRGQVLMRKSNLTVRSSFRWSLTAISASWRKNALASAIIGHASHTTSVGSRIESDEPGTWTEPGRSPVLGQVNK